MRNKTGKYFLAFILSLSILPKAHASGGGEAGGGAAALLLMALIMRGRNHWETNGIVAFVVGSAAGAYAGYALSTPSESGNAGGDTPNNVRYFQVGSYSF
jgi:hypothetical protein